jgi:hypothetical protein
MALVVKNEVPKLKMGASVKNRHGEAGKSDTPNASYRCKIEKCLGVSIGKARSV